MQIKFHGGLCCGIKHINGFYGQPSQTVWEKAETQKRHNDRYGDSFESRWDFCWEALPQQTNKERLIAYIDFLKRERPSGAIELTLLPEQLDIYGWRPVIEELGFKKVVEFWNSNSGNKVFVYYLVYGGKKCAIEAYEDYENSYDEDDDYYEGDD